MSHARFTALGAICLMAVAIPAAAQFNSQTGRPNDPSTYEGSKDNEAQMQATQQHLDQSYAAYAPRSGGGGGGGRSSAPPLKLKPLLPAAKNPLLGMWRMGEAKPMDLGPVLNKIPGTPEIVNGAFGGVCTSMLGKPDTVIRFTPSQLNWVAPDGHDEILNKVEYRSDGPNVIVIAEDGAALIFGMPNHDHAVAALFGCRMSRTNTAARLAGASPRPGASGQPATPAPGRVGTLGAGKARLAMKVGQMVNGQMSPPPAPVRLFLSTQDPDANLAKAGFTPNPIDALFASCDPKRGGNQQRCSQGMTALTAGRMVDTQSDANGNAAAEEVAPGHYYLVGVTPYNGHILIWHMPVDLRAGPNSVNLTPQNGSVSP